MNALRILLLVCVAARLSPGETLSIRTYTATDGLGSSFVSNVMEDSTGYLWFSTRDGLSRYNGYEFITYSREDGLSVSIVSKCMQTVKGEYFVLTNDGKVFTFPISHKVADSHGHWKTSFIPVNIPSASRSVGLNRLYEGPTGILWGGGDNCVIRGVGTTNTRIQLSPEIGPRSEITGVTAIKEDLKENLWVGTGRGLYRLQNGTVTDYLALGPNESGDLIHDIAIDGSGRLWIAHEHLGVIVFLPDTSSRHDAGPRQLTMTRNAGAPVSLPELPGQAVAFSTVDGLTDNDVTTILPGAEYIWIGTAKGLTRFDGKVFTGITTRNGLASNIIHSLAEDRSGGLWIGTPAGAMCLSPLGMVSYTLDESEANLNVALIGETKEGTIYAVGRDWWISQISNRHINSSRPRLPAGATIMWASQIAYRDSHDRWWALTSKGLFLFAKAPGALPSPDAPPMRVFSTRDGLLNDHIFRVYEDTHGTFWIATRTGDPRADGLACLDANLASIRVLRDIPGLPTGNAPSAFAEDSSGNLWIGFYNGGLTRHHNGRFTSFGQKDGIPVGPVSDLLVDHSRRLWVSTGQDGICCIDNPARDSLSVTRYNKENGLSSNYVRRLAEDRFGRIYAGTVRGVDRLDLATGSSTHITMNDGLVGDFISEAYCDSHGDLWFGTYNGVSCLRPVAPQRSPSPPIMITGIRVSGDEYPVSELGTTFIEGLVLEPDQRELSIDFSSIALYAVRDIRYQYAMNGENDQWSIPRLHRSVDFARLAPGSYRFKVRAVSPDGIVSSQPACVSFIVLPRAWQRWWFQLGALILVAAALLLLYRWRIRKLREIERVRLAIASDLHDEVATNLSSIAMFSALLHSKNADPAGLLERITSLATESVNVIRDIIWSIDPKVETIASLMARLRDTMIVACRARGMRLTVVIPTEVEIHSTNLTPEQRKNLWLMLKEAVNNALKHSSGSELIVHASPSGKMMRFVVSDNGRGCDPSRHTWGKGLGTMHMRAGLLGGTMTIQSSPDTGTVVDFSIKLRA